MSQSLQKNVLVMLNMQDSLNKAVFPDWRVRQLAWHRAIYVEAAEFLDHLGTWKWWKKGHPDFPQANMELVDIWHFGLSWSLDNLYRGDMDALAALLTAKMTHSLDHLQRVHGCAISPENVDNEVRHEQVDLLVKDAGDRSFAFHAFITLLFYSGMDFDELYKRYVGKNVLNRFRQENGYKTGTYRKVWQGREDNVHLDEIVNALPGDELLPVRVAEALQLRYDQAC